MWSRITDLAVKIDDVARAVGGDDESPDNTTAGAGAEEDGMMEIAEDGWGDDYDDDDDVGFDDNDFDDDDDDDDDRGGANHDEYEPSLTSDGVSDHGQLSTSLNEGGAVELEEDCARKATSDSLHLGPGCFQTQRESTSSEESAVIVEEHPSPPSPMSLQEMLSQLDLHRDVVTVSAPGKVLIAGGYLILESNNPGIVLAAEGCRFHTTMKFQSPYSTSVSSSVEEIVNDVGWHFLPLDVYSPQFDQVFTYHLSYSSKTAEMDDDDGIALRLRPRMSPHKSNKFIERTLLLALGYLRQSMGAEAFHARLHPRCSSSVGVSSLLPPLALAMKLRADNDFYSQSTQLRERGLDVTPANLAMLDPFLPCPKDDTTGEVVVNKTGMGSSAALVASMVGALLLFFDVIALPSSPMERKRMGGSYNNANGVEVENTGYEGGLRTAHNLAQICHCYAQGKVGSGFDISSAIYGSHIYTRFSDGFVNEFLENVQTSLLSKDKDDELQLSEVLSTRLVALVNTGDWDCTVRPISLPLGLELLMADVCGGSESPSMARDILEWKKNKRKVGFMDDYYWKDLKRCNKMIVHHLTEQLATQSVLDGLRRDGPTIISTRTAEQWKKPMPSSWHMFDGSSWDVALKLFDLRLAFLECRQNLKGMGKSAGVPVEPDEQTYLADATMALPGVVAAGVPGAGGYDAIFVLYVKGPATCDGKSDQVRDEIVNLWKEMSDRSDGRVVCPLSVRAAGPRGGLCSSKLDW